MKGAAARKRKTRVGLEAADQHGSQGRLNGCVSRSRLVCTNPALYKAALFSADTLSYTDLRDTRTPASSQAHLTSCMRCPALAPSPAVARYRLARLTGGASRTLRSALPIALDSSKSPLPRTPPFNARRHHLAAAGFLGARIIPLCMIRPYYLYLPSLTRP